MIFQEEKQLTCPTLRMIKEPLQKGMFRRKLCLTVIFQEEKQLTLQATTGMSQKDWWLRSQIISRTPQKEWWTLQMTKRMFCKKWWLTMIFQEEKQLTCPTLRMIKGTLQKGMFRKKWWLTVIFQEEKQLTLQM